MAIQQSNQIPRTSAGGRPAGPEKWQCLECGRWFLSLESHVKRAHGLSKHEYRQRHALAIRGQTGAIEHAAGEQPTQTGKWQCLECGRWYLGLVGHLAGIHGLTSGEYRRRHRLGTRPVDDR
jgi:predicted transcriptional regulator